MAVYKPSEARQQKGQTAPQEPNLVPIMNLFLTIIPFMLMMVVVSQVSLIALNFSQGEGGGGGPGAGGSGAEVLEKVEIHTMGKVFQQNNQFLGMEIREKGLDIKRIPAVNDNYDYQAMDLAIKDLRSRKPNLTEVTVVMYPDVLFQDLMRTIDICKSNGLTSVNYKAAAVQYY